MVTAWPLTLVVTIIGLMDSPEPVEPTNSNSTLAPPTGLGAGCPEPSTDASRTTAVKVVVLRVVPILGFKTDTPDCKMMAAAFDVGALMAKVREVVVNTLPAESNASICTVALPALLPGTKVCVLVVAKGPVVVKTFPALASHDPKDVA